MPGAPVRSSRKPVGHPGPPAPRWAPRAAGRQGLPLPRATTVCRDETGSNPAFATHYPRSAAGPGTGLGQVGEYFRRRPVIAGTKHCGETPGPRGEPKGARPPEMAQSTGTGPRGGRSCAVPPRTPPPTRRHPRRPAGPGRRTRGRTPPTGNRHPVGKARLSPRAAPDDGSRPSPRGVAPQPGGPERPVSGPCAFCDFYAYLQLTGVTAHETLACGPLPRAPGPPVGRAVEIARGARWRTSELRPPTRAERQ